MCNNFKEAWWKVGKNKTSELLQSVRVKGKRWDRLFESGVPVQVLFRSVILDPQPRVMALELLKKLMIFWICCLISFSKSLPLPLFNCRGTDFLNYLSSNNIEKKEKFGKSIKVPLLFVRGCNFTRCWTTISLC